MIELNTPTPEDRQSSVSTVLMMDAGIDAAIPDELIQQMKSDYMTGRFTCHALHLKYAVDKATIAWFVRKRGWLRDLVNSGLLPPIDQFLVHGGKRRFFGTLSGGIKKEYKAEIEKHYCDPTIPLDHIAKRFSIKTNSLKMMAKREGWTEKRDEAHKKIVNDPRVKVDYSIAGLIDEAGAHLRRLIRMEQEFPGTVMDPKEFHRNLQCFSEICKSAATLMGVTEKQRENNNIPKPQEHSDSTPLAMRPAPLLNGK